MQTAMKRTTEINTGAQPAVGIVEATMKKYPELSTSALMGLVLSEHAAGGCAFLPGVTPEALARGLPDNPNECKDEIIMRIGAAEVFCPHEKLNGQPLDQRPYNKVIVQIEEGGWEPSRENVAATRPQESFATLKAA
jgi:hypothetical protein